MVKFIDFSSDGYTRTSRRKSTNNLKDTDRAKERYEELVNLVRFGSSKLNIFTDNEYYENTIDPKNGTDWNQSTPIDTKPTLDDLNKIGVIPDIMNMPRGFIEINNILFDKLVKFAYKIK